MPTTTAMDLLMKKMKKTLYFTSISNLITTHSNVFAVYVTARIVNSDASQSFAEKNSLQLLTVLLTL